MLDSIKHRGPDQQGIVKGQNHAFGCRRLAVIDIEGGKQPMTNEKGNLIVVFNGEIFNYREIRDELKNKHQFKSLSDTEVILHAYEEWGTDCLKHFNGMFAFAVWDGTKLFMARDRMGEKPLYYHYGKKGFFFASEIKALLTMVEGVPVITPEFEAFEYPCGGDTYYENIKSLDAGCYIEYDSLSDQHPVEKRYWTLPEEEEKPVRKQEDYIDELRTLIEDAVRIRLRSDVPVGIFLSGGLDSALIASLGGSMPVFHCRFPEGELFDEFDFMKKIAEHMSIEPIVVTPTPEDFMKMFPRMIWHLDGPISTMSSIGEFSLASSAKGKIKVVLGGQGADELFGGYVRYLLMAEEEKVVNSAPFKHYVPLAKKLWGKDFGEDPALRYFTLMNRAGKMVPEAFETVKSCFDKKMSMLNKMALTDIRIQLPALLTMNDRAAAAYGIENRSPYLDYRIVEFAFRIPSELKIKNNKTKWILREAARGLIPEDIIERQDKKGLVTPVGKWLKGTLKNWAEKILENRIEENNSSHLGFFDRSIYHKLSLKVWEKVRKMSVPPGDNEPLF